MYLKKCGLIDGAASSAMSVLLVASDTRPASHPIPIQPRGFPSELGGASGEDAKNGLGHALAQRFLFPTAAT